MSGKTTSEVDNSTKRPLSSPEIEGNSSKKLSEETTCSREGIGHQISPSQDMKNMNNNMEASINVNSVDVQHTPEKVETKAVNCTVTENEGATVQKFESSSRNTDIHNGNPRCEHGSHYDDPIHVSFDAILKTIHGELCSIRADVSDIKLDIVDMKTSNNQVKTNMDELKNDVKNEMKSLIESVDFISKQYDKHCEEMQELRDENKVLRNKVTDMEYKLDELNQYSRKNNILFDDIKEQKGEDTDELVIAQCDKLGIAVDKTNIVTSHRLPTKHNVPNKPRPIIARFSSARTSKHVLVATKEQFKQEAKSVNPVKARVHLSELRAFILKECLSLRNNKHIAACWVYNYNIFIKKKESDVNATKIVTLEQLKNFYL